MAAGVERVDVYRGEIGSTNEQIEGMINYLLEGVRQSNDRGLRDLLYRFLKNRTSSFGPSYIRSLLGVMRRCILENAGENSIEEFTKAIKRCIPISQESLEDDNEVFEEDDPYDVDGGKRRRRRTRRSSKRRTSGGKRRTTQKRKRRSSRRRL
jgi:hypothetical protein